MRYFRLAKYLLVVGLFYIVINICLRFGYISEADLKRRNNPIPDELYKLVSPSTYKYMLNQPSACEHNPFLVLMVPVPPGDRDSRNAVRKTWGQRDLVDDVKIVKLFFVGIPAVSQKEQTQYEIAEENFNHADVILMDFIDTYQNLTVKTMMMMHWLATYCQSASYVMKVDADVFLNIYYLVNYLPRPPKTNYITGSVIKDGMPRRNEQSKWYISKADYPDSTFPPYLSGAGYVFSIDLASKISMASRFVRPISLEDVYIGLCLKLLGVSPTYGRSRFWVRNLFEVRHLNFDKCTFSRLIIVTDYGPTKLTQTWPDFQKDHSEC